jgi:glucose-1-phosphate adenylyltransferase
MGADFYESLPERESNVSSGIIPVGIGAESTIRRAIIDKNARIGRNVAIVNKDRIEDAERESEGFYIRNGIVVVLKNAIIPDGTIV